MRINIRALNEKNILKFLIFLWSFMYTNFARADMIDPGWKPSIPMDTVPGGAKSIQANDFANLFFVRASVGLVVVIICLAVALFIISKVKKKK